MLIQRYLDAANNVVTMLRQRRVFSSGIEIKKL